MDLRRACTARFRSVWDELTLYMTVIRGKPSNDKCMDLLPRRAQAGAVQVIMTLHLRFLSPDLTACRGARSVEWVLRVRRSRVNSRWTGKTGL